MNTAIQREGLRAFVESVLGCQVYWEKEGRPAVSPEGQAIAALKITSRSQKGWDDGREVFDDTTNRIVRTAVGPRRAVVQCKVESYDADVFAADIAEQLRMATGAAPNCDALDVLLEDFGLSVIGIRNVLDLTEDSAEERYSVAVFDVSVAYHVLLDDKEVAGAGNWIESVEVIDKLKV